jgi:hypothetical protein
VPPALPRLLLITSPDGFLLELERHDFEAEWRDAHPDGETTTFEPAPPAERLVQEIASPSLFAPERLLLVPDSGPYLGERGPTAAAGEALARALETLPLAGVTLVLAAAAGEPNGALAEVVARRGEVRFLPVPPAPKPWQDVRITPEQRAVLADKVLRRVAPSLLADAEVVDALAEAYGFRPRELAQAAQSLVLAGTVSADAVRAQAGAGEVGPRHLETALMRRDARTCAAMFAALDAGATLLSGWGDPIAPDRHGVFLAQTLERFLRQALAARAHALRADLGRELDPRRCGENNWYIRTFRPKLLAKLQGDIDANPGSPLTDKTAWQLHLAFRLGAAYSESVLLAALARLAASGAERMRGAAARIAVGTVALGLIADAAA